MCTSICFRPNDCYFGRNLDAEFSFCEEVVITPRHFHFAFRDGRDFQNQYALIGMAAVIDGTPLYYEATNEVGLSMAGLNFPNNAVYLEPMEGADNVTSSEIVAYLLGKAKTVAEAREILQNVRMTNFPFNDAMPIAPLHFMLSDKTESIVIEPTAEGLKIYDNPYDVMTNNPPFPYHMWNMQNYLNLSRDFGENRFTDKYELKPFGVGMGAMGLPGDASSASRFVRVAFHLANSAKGETEEENVGQFFHLLDSVAMFKGSTLTKDGKEDLTLYSCCCNADKGIYYYKRYDNNRITAIHMHHENLDAEQLITYPIRKTQDIYFEN